MKSSRRQSPLYWQSLNYSGLLPNELQQQIHLNQSLGASPGATSPSSSVPNPEQSEQVARIDNDPDFYHALPYVVNPDLTYQKLGVSQLIPIYEHLAQDAHISGIIQRCLLYTSDAADE